MTIEQSVEKMSNDMDALCATRVNLKARVSDLFFAWRNDLYLKGKLRVLNRPRQIPKSSSSSTGLRLRESQTLRWMQLLSMESLPV